MRTIILFLVLGAVAAFAALWFMRDEPLPESRTTPEAGPISLQGEVVCLPHRDTSGPQTLECAYGLRGSDDNYYWLRDENATSSPSALTSIPTGSRVTVSGTFTPGQDAQYATVGIITVEQLDVAQSEQPSAVTHADGTIQFRTPTHFGLAGSKEQILVTAAVPPCTEGRGFDSSNTK